jgi:sulfonate dioxygenase
MAPVATSEQQAPSRPVKVAEKVFNPFYSPPSGDDGDDSYKYAHYKVGSLAQALSYTY